MGKIHVSGNALAIQLHTREGPSKSSSVRIPLLFNRSPDYRVSSITTTAIEDNCWVGRDAYLINKEYRVALSDRGNPLHGINTPSKELFTLQGAC